MNASAYSHLSMAGLPDYGSDGYVTAIALETFEPAVDRMRKEILEMAKASGSRADTSFKEDEHLSFWLAVSDLPLNLDRQFSGLIKAKLNYPISSWKDIIESAESILSQADLNYTLQAHAGNGICLVGLLIDEKDTTATDRAAGALEQLLKRCREIDGNLVIQSAPPDIKGKLKMWGEIGSDFVVMKRLKDRLDSSSIMSPGRYVGGL
jgi:FAD/FMN-containing dehydrogenase